MVSDSQTCGKEQTLSPNASSVASLVSTKTDEHNELYDHRAHPVSVPKKPSAAARNQGGDGDGSNRCHYSGDGRVAVYGLKQEEPGRFKRSAITSGITFEDDSDEEYSKMASNSIRPGGATRTGSARPSRVAHSMPFQQQLYNPSKDTFAVDTDGTGHHSAGAKPRRGSKAPSVTELPLKNNKSRAFSESSSQGNAAHFLTRTVSYKSQDSGYVNARRNRKLSVGSDDSNASRESQETEEDVCFPMQQPEHTRINGIDFDELEEFAVESIRIQTSLKASVDMIGAVDSGAKFSGTPGTSSGTSTSISSAALKYVPKEVYSHSQQNSLADVLAPGVSFGNNKVEVDEYVPTNDHSSHMNESAVHSATNNQDINSTTPPPNYKIPDRFSFFCSDAGETIHAPDLPSLVEPGQSYREFFRNGADTWWLDCICPTDEEMRCIAKAFGIHPLTAEDIRMQETREKVELFKSYYFVCFHTFENDPESEDFLEPINIYMVVFRNGVLTFHFTPVSHPASVRRRVRQLRDYVDVNSDWICYALIDDITDSFAPVIQAIEYEADVIEDSVFMYRDMDVAAMLQTIGEGRRKTMTLMRLLSGKADVIKMFAKRCQDEANGIGPALTSEINIANLQYGQPGDISPRFRPQILAQSAQQQQNRTSTRSQPRADIALYLGDIQDHVITMFQNLLSYEKIFSRSHSNYLAQLQVESFRCNNRVTEMLGRVTMIGTMLVPLNLITGLFGMNVKVPGDSGSGNYYWFIGIVLFLIILATGSCFFSSWWISRANTPTTLNEAAESATRSVLRFGRRNNPQSAGRPAGNKSVISSPSRFTRYY
ncbi:Mg(2+) transporter ALR1 Ecym_2039 [Eremothecium cymbalariae DBVPG|uniref:Uncharacterized protein n=1 Tax=Eremothecium cymbalariae (strain CBS 270.75 / DBVPG 7215 / KCTC 17166 / NRRL Y-17582) TaxID=931890 RepID=G8JNZ7_ERECY|nr:Hypothetical protein Ecym_2039 [Eremothecium cymbalariae DBVPG\